MGWLRAFPLTPQRMRDRAFHRTEHAAIAPIGRAVFWIAGMEGETGSRFGKSAFDAAQRSGSGEHGTFSGLAFRSRAAQYQRQPAVVNVVE
jgi:hypothetical protein